jgi:Lon protease-like protein
VATLLSRLLEQAGSALPTHLRQQVDDASWLGYRMAELLPLSINERQLLLETDDPAERLQQLLYILPRFQRE